MQGYYEKPMTCDLAGIDCANAIAKIHQREISAGFMSSLHLDFLTSFYEALIRSSCGFCVVARENGQVIGFISGVSDVKAFHKYFLKNYFFKSLSLLYKKIFNVLFVKNIVENLLYPSKEKMLPPAELLAMAVSSEFRGKGVAGVMVLEFVNEMKRRGVGSFKLIVGEALKPAIGFYEKHGFRFVKNTSLHSDMSSRIYVYDILEHHP